MYGYIYETTNLVNNKKYIGQHKSDYFDENYKGSGKYLWKAINKYGLNNFSVRLLCPCFSQEELDIEEIFLISYFDAVNSADYYNLQAGGHRGNIAGSKLSESTRKKLSLIRKGKLVGPDNPMYKKRHTLEARQKMSASRVGKQTGKDNPRFGVKLSEKELLNLSLKFSGENNPMYGKKHRPDSIMKMVEAKLGDNNPCSGKVWITKDTCNKRVLPEELPFYLENGWKKGRYVTDETRRKCSERNRRRYSAK